MSRFLLFAIAVVLCSEACWSQPPVTKVEVPPRTVKGVTASEWAKQVQHPSVAARREAISALWQLFPESKVALPQLIQALADSDPKVRELAASVLSRFGPEAKDAVGPLANMLSNKAWEGQEKASDALYRIGWSPAAVPGILRSIEAGNHHYANQLKNMGEAAAAIRPRLLQLLNHPQPRVRRAALCGLWASNARGADLIAEVLPFLEDPDLDSREEAIRLLGALGPDAAAAVPTLKLIPYLIAPRRHDLSHFRDPETAHLVALARIAPRDEQLVPLLQQALEVGDDPNFFTAEMVTTALGYAAAQNPQALAQLIQFLASPNERLASAAARGCKRAGATILPTLDRALQSKLTDERTIRGKQHAAKAILLIDGALNAQRIQAILPLVAGTTFEQTVIEKIPVADKAAGLQGCLLVLNDTSPAARVFAIHCLNELKPSAAEVVPQLTKLLDDPFPRVRFSAAIAIARLAPAQGSLAVPELLEALEAIDDREGITISDLAPHRQLAAEALGAIAASDPALTEPIHEAIRSTPIARMPDLVEAMNQKGAAPAAAVRKMLADRRAEVRLQALEMLANSGTTEREVVIQLVDYLQADDGRTQRLAARALHQSGPAAELAIPVLVKMLVRDPLTSPAANVLARIGPAAVPAVTKLLDEEGHAQRAALDILAAIGPAAREALPAIVTISKKDSFRRREAARAIIAICVPAARERDSEQDDRFTGEQSPIPPRPPADVVPLIVDVLPDPAAATILVAHPDLAEPHLAKVIDKLKQSRSGERKEILQVLGAQKQRGKPAIEVIRQLMVEPDYEGRLATMAFARILGEEAIDELVKQLDAKGPAANDKPPSKPVRSRDSVSARVHAAAALGYIETGLPRFVPELIRALHDENHEVNSAALTALGNFPLFKLHDLATAELAKFPANTAPGSYARGFRQRLEVEDHELERATFPPPKDEPRLRTTAEIQANIRRALETIANSDNDQERMTAALVVLHSVRLVPAAEAIPAIAKALRSPPPKNRYNYALEEDSRWLVLQFLRRYGAAAEPALPTLIDLTKQHPSMTEAWAKPVSAIGPAAVPTLQRALASNDPAQQLFAAHALGLLGPIAKPAIPEMRQFLKKAPYNEDELVYTLKRWANVGLPDDLCQDYLDQSAKSELAQAAVVALAPHNPSLQDRLIALLVDPDPKRARFAAKALAAVEKLHEPLDLPKELIEKLGRLAANPPAVELDDELQNVVPGRKAFWVLEHLGAKAEPSIPHLIGILKAKDVSAAASAVDVLASIGPPARAALPALAKSLKSQRSLTELRNFANQFGGSYDSAPTVGLLNAIVKIGGPDSSADVAAALADPFPQTRNLAYTELLAWGPQAKPATAALVTALSSRDPRVRSDALHLLTILGPSSAEAAAALSARLQDDRAYNHKTAARALARMGAAARETKPAFETLRNDPFPSVRLAAEAALKAIP